MGWIGCIRCEKIGHSFVARTFALIAPFQLILHRVSCSNEMVPNAAKHYETQQRMSLGNNGMDWVHSLWKHLTWLCGLNFCINYNSSAHFVIKQRNGPKCTQTLRNRTKHDFRVQWGGSGAFIAKKLRGMNFCIDCTSWGHFESSFIRWWNAPKCTQTRV